MNRTAQQFREDLQAQALACDWDAWHATRLIFADWLQERDNPEAATCRADWQLASKPILMRHQKHPWCYRFQCPVLRQPRLLRLQQAHNSQWLLGFAPCTLKLAAISFGGGVAPSYPANWTWVPSRHRSRWKKMDTEVHKAGFLTLFLLPKQPMPLFEGEP